MALISGCEFMKCLWGAKYRKSAKNNTFDLMGNRSNSPVTGILCSSVSLGGLELNLVKWAVWLRERGQNILFFCVKESPVHGLAQREELEIVPIKRHWKYYDIEAAMALRKRLKKLNVEVLIISDNRDLSIAALIKSSRGGRVGLIYAQAMQIGRPKRDVLHTIRYNQIDIWVTPLPYLARQVQLMTRFDPGRIAVIPYGIELKDLLKEKPSRAEARKQFGLSEDDFVVGVIGRIDPKKGQHLLLDAIANLLPKFPQVRGLIVGDPTLNEPTGYMDAITSRIEDADLKGKISINGFIENPLAFFRAADVCALTSESETYGMVTIEAMAAGTLVVGTKAGGTADLLGQGKFGYLFEPNSSEAFTQTLLHIIQNPVEAEEVKKSGTENTRQQYSAEVFCQRLQEVIEKVTPQL